MRFTSVLMLVLLVMPMALAADYSSMDETQLEKAAYQGLYDTVIQMSRNIDNLDPMKPAKGDTFESVLEQKIALTEMAINALEPLVGEPYHSNKGEPFADLYSKANTEKALLTDRLADLKEFQNKKVNEDGEIEDSGFLGMFKDKYDNDKMKTEAKEAKPDDDDPDDDSGFIGYVNWTGWSKTWWILLIGIGLIYGISKRNSIGAAIGGYRRNRMLSKLENKQLDETNKKILALLASIVQKLEKSAGTLTSNDSPAMREFLEKIREWTKSVEPSSARAYKKELKKIISSMDKDSQKRLMVLVDDFVKLGELFENRADYVKQRMDRLGSGAASPVQTPQVHDPEVEAEPEPRVEEIYRPEQEPPAADGDDVSDDG